MNIVIIIVFVKFFIYCLLFYYFFREVEYIIVDVIDGVNKFVFLNGESERWGQVYCVYID